MPLHKNFITKAVKDAVKNSCITIPSEELEKVLSSAIYQVLNSRDFESYIKEITKR